MSDTLAKEQVWEMQGETCQISISSAALPVSSVLPLICPTLPVTIQNRGPTWQTQKCSCVTWISIIPSFGHWTPRDSIPHHPSIPGSWILPTVCSDCSLKQTSKAYRSLLVPYPPGSLTFLFPFITRHFHLPSVLP